MTRSLVSAKQPKDYHGIFNHEYCLTWFQRLLDELAARRQYQDDTTFQEVGQRLDAACTNLTSHSIFGCIRKAEYDLLDPHRHVSIVDDDNYQEDNEVAGDASDGTESSSTSQDSANDAGF
ncbi:hypothetical protein H257_18148 [Aphanomyces astaci]|uniref:Uncharacterized protein n=1 Tax=Aphanomyces astaci TaxID=112090 RepID=W4FC66_APHAT|nr:hypothetical protein H257_18148 [Aphanomyces astaci]ETV65062.1 hypothetical protein H257_18148 [Aphanomyces astaci]|eukprot:XP_009845461.1 hypothetical protein H257_18148 [Aphanomyces astaci]